MFQKILYLVIDTGGGSGGDGEDVSTPPPPTKISERDVPPKIPMRKNKNERKERKNQEK